MSGYCCPLMSVNRNSDNSHLTFGNFFKSRMCFAQRFQCKLRIMALVSTHLIFVSEMSQLHKRSVSEWGFMFLWGYYSVADRSSRLHHMEEQRSASTCRCGLMEESRRSSGSNLAGRLPKLCHLLSRLSSLNLLPGQHACSPHGVRHDPPVTESLKLKQTL